MVDGDIYKQVVSYVSRDQLDEALKVLLNHFEHHEIINQSARLQAMKNDLNQGIITIEDARVERNRLRNAILSLAEETRRKETKNSRARILRKLNLFLNFIRKEKKNRYLAALSLLLLLYWDALKMVAVGVVALSLTVLGANYIIEYNEKLLEKKDGSIGLKIDDQMIQDSLLVLAGEIDSLKGELKKYKSDVAILMDSIKSLSDITLTPEVIKNTETYNNLAMYYNELLCEIEKPLSLLKAMSEAPPNTIFLKKDSVITELHNSYLRQKTKMFNN